MADKENNKTRVEVVEGNVAVESGGEEVAVSAGFATITAAGQSPFAPKQLLDAPNIKAIPQLFKGTVKFNLPQQEGAEGDVYNYVLLLIKTLKFLIKYFLVHPLVFQS